jgi:SAM-dependent methyltransferase
MDYTGTYGEEKLITLLEKLPSNEYTCYYQPRIDYDRSCRYPDFIVICRRSGIVAIEVKDWYTIINDQCDQQTVTVKDKTGQIKKHENPARTAKKYADNLIDLFENNRVLMSSYQGREKLSFPCEGIAILTHIPTKGIEALEKRGVFPPNKVFSGEVLYDVNAFIRVLSRIQWAWKLSAPMSDQIVEIIKHSIKLPTINDPKSPGKKIGELNPEQEEIVYKPIPIRGGGFCVDLIRGSVGSGKTLVLCKKADHISKLRPDLKILVTAFNLDLTRDLRKQIQNPKVEVIAFYDLCKKILGDEWPKLEIYRGEPGPATIKKWVSNLEEELRDEGLTTEYVALEIARRKDMNLDADEKYIEDVRNRKEPLTKTQIEAICSMYQWYQEHRDTLKQNGQDYYDYEDIPELTLRALFGHKMERYYDVIMIDEAQDWAPRWIQIIKRLLKPGGYLFICDDPAQSLWRFFDWKQKGLPPNYNKIYLELPERNTKQIMEFAQSLFDIDAAFLPGYDMDVVYPVKTDHLKPGRKPLSLTFPNQEHEYNTLLEEIKKLLSSPKITGEQIGILCPFYNQTAAWRERDFINVNKIYVGHFNVMKGLEFNTVLIPHLETGLNFTNSSSISSVQIMRKLFVAMTRARENLIISFVGDVPEIIKPLMVYAEVINF